MYSHTLHYNFYHLYMQTGQTANASEVHNAASPVFAVMWWGRYSHCQVCSLVKYLMLHWRHTLSSWQYFVIYFRPVPHWYNRRILMKTCSVVLLPVKIFFYLRIHFRSGLHKATWFWTSKVRLISDPDLTAELSLTPHVIQNPKHFKSKSSTNVTEVPIVHFTSSFFQSSWFESPRGCSKRIVCYYLR